MVHHCAVIIPNTVFAPTYTFTGQKLLCLAIRTKINPQIKELRWRSHFLIEKKSNLITGGFSLMWSKRMCCSVQSLGSASLNWSWSYSWNRCGWMAAPALNGVKDALGCNFWPGMLKLEHQKDTPETPRKTVQLFARLLECFNLTNPLKEKRKKK